MKGSPSAPHRQKRMTPEKVDEPYELLSSEYSLVSGRTDALTNRAQELLVFGGIIDAILVAIIVQVTNADARAFLAQYTNLSLLRAVATFGFVFYVSSVICSLVAYRSRKYFPVPQLGRKFVKAVISGEAKVNKQTLLLPIADAIMFYQAQNDKKYVWLRRGTLSMLVAVFFTAFLGIILLLSIG